jgi:NAD(P)-dependent dehydrogenase (short-subunit alcohol dehydrogenase family)
MTGRSAVVTGAAKGIGFAIASALGQAGAEVVLSDVNAEGLEEAAQRLREAGHDCVAIPADVTSSESIQKLVDQVLATTGRIDLLVNNAGVGLGGPFEAINLTEWQWIIDINLLGVIRATHAVLPHMRAQGSGHIVNVASSVALFHNAPFAIPYVTTKTALLGLSRSLSDFLQPAGIGVTLLCPDNTDTGFRENSRVVGVDRADVIAKLPNTTFQSAEAVADALLDGLRDNRFLVSLTPDARERLVEQAAALFEETSGTPAA